MKKAKLPVYSTEALFNPIEDEYIVIDQVNGTKDWRKVVTDKNGNRTAELHRLDGPARIESNGTESWFKRGYYHRRDGPARIDGYSGEHEWWIMGRPAETFEVFQKLSKCSNGELVMLKLKWGSKT